MKAALAILYTVSVIGGAPSSAVIAIFPSSLGHWLRTDVEDLSRQGCGSSHRKRNIKTYWMTRHRKQVVEPEISTMCKVVDKLLPSGPVCLCTRACILLSPLARPETLINPCRPFQTFIQPLSALQPPLNLINPTKTRNIQLNRMNPEYAR